MYTKWVMSYNRIVSIVPDWISAIDQEQEAMQKLLLEWSCINSHSHNIEGLTAMLSAVKSEINKKFPNLDIQEIDLKPETIIDEKGNTIQNPLGKCLSIKKPSTNPHTLRVLLMGHLDTVYPRGSSFQTCTQIDAKTLNGPGVADLKGGLIVMLKALEYFERSPNADKISWEIFLNPDEELGSPSSSELFPAIAERNDIGLIYEPSLSDGSIAYKRKGAGNFTVVFRGKSAHVGREFHAGTNAILAAAKFTDEIYKLNHKSIIINPGKINGGGPLNVVPDLAILGINVRVDDAKFENKFLDKLETTKHKLCKQFPNLQIEIHGKFNRKAKIPNQDTQKLFKLIQSCAQDLGQHIKPQDTGGCCDGNNLHNLGLTNIDTLGVRGGKIHSPEEFICLESLTERAKLSALLLNKLALLDRSAVFNTPQ